MCIYRSIQGIEQGYFGLSELLRARVRVIEFTQGPTSLTIHQSISGNPVFWYTKKATGMDSRRTKEEENWSAEGTHILRLLFGTESSGKQ
jgi:hypothetical protein